MPAPSADAGSPVVGEGSIAAASPSHVLEVTPDGPLDARVLPAQPGVALFEDLGGRAALIATTADLRGLARRRLGLDPSPETSDAEPAPPRTDHRAVTRRVLAYATGSSLESDVLYLALARMHLPVVYRTVRQRWEAWVVHVDPAARFPDWTRAALAAESALPETGELFGPFPDRDIAARFIAAAIDAFDLCREHALLMQTPHARPCPYKELGRCPAPCDGTEPLVSYHARVRRAVEVLRGGLARMRERLDADMRAAAAAMEFEHAGQIKAQLDRLKPLAVPALAHAADLRRWRAAIVVPAAAAARSRPAVRVLAIIDGQLTVLGECGLDDEPSALAAREAVAAAAAARVSASAPVARLTSEAIDTLCVFTRWLHTPAARRRGELITLPPAFTADWLASEILHAGRALSRRRAAASPEPEIQHQAAPEPT